MVLGEIISTVEFSGSPIQIELFLSDAIAQPVIAHVKCFGFFHTNLGMKDTMSSGIVGFERSTSDRLLMAHFFKGSANGDGILCIEEQTASFGFGGGGSNSANGFAENMNGTVAFGIRRITGG